MEQEWKARSVRWARRTDFGEEANALSVALGRARTAGLPLVDVTVSNPTRCGLEYGAAGWLDALASPAALQYDADPLGLYQARRAVAEGYYGARGTAVAPDRVLLSASTSEAYGYLFRLLCDPGDEVLVPQPSYPLFEMLARMQDVVPVRYPLHLHDGWRVDWEALRSRISPRSRAIVVVHPNNPTGHAANGAEQAMFKQVAAEHGLALIVDEVFLDFGLGAVPLKSFAAGASPALTFVLSGLSKVLALPQMKLAWTAVCGPEAEAAEAMHRLGYIADTFLSVGGPVQHALGAWLPHSGAVQAGMKERVRENLVQLEDLLLGTSCSRMPVQAGWCVLVRVPAVCDDEGLALQLLESHGVVVHPGSFYGLPDKGWLVLSLLVPPAVFNRGVTLLLTAVEQMCNGEPTLSR